MADGAASARARSPQSTVDPDDIARFERLGDEWWAADGPMRMLHRLNPVRIAYIRDRLIAHFPIAGEPRRQRKGRPLAGIRLLDIGCGGGILCEPLARLGAVVTGIDPAPGNVEAARRHAERQRLDIAYRAVTAESLAAEGARFDVVLAMEVVEHVTDVAAFVATACGMVEPGGLLFAATLNRTLKSFALAIVGAEYVLGWLPKGTHRWEQFVKPSELSAAIARAGLRTFERTGVVYDPLADSWRQSRDMDVNYMLAARRPGALESFSRTPSGPPA
jgi:2-polyprenyl-6-hydroxyphenyl methylase/3-demethylubiquinone-9 3-methyltransferase